MGTFILGSKRYSKEKSASLDGVLQNLEKKDPKMHVLVTRKMDEIALFPEHYKPLAGGMAGLRRAHVGTNKVLTYSIDYNKSAVIFQDFGGYDQIYHK